MSNVETMLSKEYLEKYLTTNICNKKWNKINRLALLSLLPKTYTHIANINTDHVVSELKTLGIEIHNQEQFDMVIHVMKSISLLVENKENPYLVKANPDFNA